MICDWSLGRRIQSNIVMQIFYNKFFLIRRTFCLSLISIEKFRGRQQQLGVVGWLPCHHKREVGVPDILRGGPPRNSNSNRAPGREGGHFDSNTMWNVAPPPPSNLPTILILIQLKIFKKLYQNDILIEWPIMLKIILIVYIRIII